MRKEKEILVRRIASALTALCLIVAMSGSAQAATVIHTTGQIGAYHIPENRNKASVAVGYDSSTCIIDQVRVKPPVAFVRDDIVGQQDYGYITWKFEIQRRIFDGSGIDYPWKTVYVSPRELRLAVEGEAAGFDLMEHDFVGHDQSGYRVLTTIVWRDPNGSTSIQGRVVVSNDWYSALWSDPVPQHYWVNGYTVPC